MTHIIYDGTHLSQNFVSSAIFPKVNDSRNVSFLKREYDVYFKNINYINFTNVLRHFCLIFNITNILEIMFFYMQIF